MSYVVSIAAVLAAGAGGILVVAPGAASTVPSDRPTVTASHDCGAGATIDYLGPDALTGVRGLRDAHVAATNRHGGPEHPALGQVRIEVAVTTHGMQRRAARLVAAPAGRTDRGAPHATVPLRLSEGVARTADAAYVITAVARFAGHDGFCTAVFEVPVES